MTSKPSVLIEIHSKMDPLIFKKYIVEYGPYIYIPFCVIVVIWFLVLLKLCFVNGKVSVRPWRRPMTEAEYQEHYEKMMEEYGF